MFQIDYSTGGMLTAGLKVWITEFQLQDSDANQIAWLKEVMPWMDQQSWIERYS